jgi:hypothetical protein
MPPRRQRHLSRRTDGAVTPPRRGVRLNESFLGSSHFLGAEQRDAVCQVRPLSVGLLDLANLVFRERPAERLSHRTIGSQESVVCALAVSKVILTVLLAQALVLGLNLPQSGAIARSGGEERDRPRDR